MTQCKLHVEKWQPFRPSPLCQSRGGLAPSRLLQTASTIKSFGRHSMWRSWYLYRRGYATQLCSTTSFTRFAYSLRFSCHSRAASALAGEFGFGSFSSDWIEVRIAAMS